ncbi:MAG: hypothetical protein FJ100_14605 [Deltaproteobacteria bacterium]|nr:hypothetical protein [Deltaproteobacteria bacterium]
MVSPTPTAPARDPALWGWLAPVAAGPVDVWLWAAAPGRTAADVDGALAGFVAAVRNRPNPPEVWTVCTEGQLRAVARFARHEPAAEASVRAAWQLAAPAGFAPPLVAALPPGNRARVAFALTHLQGEVAATRSAEALVPRLQVATPGHARIALAGAVRPALFADVLTRTLRDRRVDLPLVAQAAEQSLKPTALAIDDELARHAALHARWQQPGIMPATGQGDTPVALAQVLALRRAMGEPVQAALVGRNAAPVLLIEAGANATGARMPDHEANWRRGQVGQAQGVTLHPQSVEAAYRFVLVREPGRQPASPGDFAALLLRLRQIANVVGALGTAGLDGVPWPMQPEARGGAVWTVWLSTSTNDEVGANAVAEARAMCAEAGWRASLLPPNWDTALGWALGVAGTAGAVLTSADGPALQAAAQKLGNAARDRQTLTRVQLLPMVRPADPGFLRWNRLALAEAALRPADLALVHALLSGPVPAGAFAGASVWLTLPRGEMQAEQGALPLAVRAKASPREMVLLQDLLQTPPPESTLDRIRVNGAPALVVLAEIAAAQPHLAARALRDTLERSGSLGPVQAWSLTLSDPAVAGERSVP